MEHVWTQLNTNNIKIDTFLTVSNEKLEELEKENAELKDKLEKMDQEIQNLEKLTEGGLIEEDENVAMEKLDTKLRFKLKDLVQKQKEDTEFCKAVNKKYTNMHFCFVFVLFSD